MAKIDVMISETEIAKKVEEIAKQIENDYKGEPLLVVGILKGASVFVSDLIRKINLDVNIDFMSVSSYGNSTESSGTVKILKSMLQQQMLPSLGWKLARWTLTELPEEREEMIE